MADSYKVGGRLSIGRSTRKADGQVIYAFRQWGRIVWTAPELDRFYPTKAECRQALDEAFLTQHYNDNPLTPTREG